MNPLRVGLIGTGGMGMGHAACIAATDKLKIVAAADPHGPSLDTFRAHEASKVAVCLDDYRKLLALPQVEAVIIAAPDYLHVGIVLEALAAGKHVLSEKPAATTRQDLERLEKAVTASGLVYQIGLEMRYHPLSRRLREIIAAGTLGRVRMIWCKEFRGPFLSKVGQWIHFQDKTGGVFVEKTCHFFDLMTWYSDSLPRQVIASAGLDVVTDIYGIRPDVFDNGWVIVEYANGVRACLGLCMFDRAQEGVEMGVTGDRGRAVMMIEKNTIDLCEFSPLATGPLCRSEVRIVVPPEVAALSHGGPVYYELLDFAENVRAGRKPLAGLDAAKWSTLVGLAAEESARSGGVPVKL
ncbi:MAG: Gfo/Idh/MocA family protein [Phycisphaerae bacterium]